MSKVQTSRFADMTHEDGEGYSDIFSNNPYRQHSQSTVMSLHPSTNIYRKVAMSDPEKIAGSNIANKKPLPGPLSGIRVLDLSWLLPGPFATEVLAELGADVIKIERPDGGDYLRVLSPALFEKVNVNKRSVSLDLKDEVGLANFHRLVETADIVVEGFRPGVAKRLGIDAESLTLIKKDLIYVSFTGYGQSGPLALRSGHDINYLALAGALSIPGHWGEEPQRSGLPVADLSASLYGVINIMAALRHRDLHGIGVHIDLSIADAVLHWGNTRFSDFDPAAAEDAWSHLKPGNDVFVTSDKRSVALGIIEEKFWINFCASTGRPDLTSLFGTESFAGKRRLRDTIASVIAEHSLEFWQKALSKHDIPFTAVNCPQDALADPQFTSRGVVSQISTLAGQPVALISFPGSAFGITRLDPSSVHSAPALGADTQTVLDEARDGRLTQRKADKTGRPLKP